MRYKNIVNSSQPADPSRPELPVASVIRQSTSRLISLVALIACIVIIGILFYKVMINFLIPLFLAAVLVVVFRPLHRRVLTLTKNNAGWAAGLTTLLVTLIVLLPASALATLATIQGIGLARNITPTSINVALSKTRNQFNLGSEYFAPIRSVDKAVEGIRQEVSSGRIDELSKPMNILTGRERTVIEGLHDIYDIYLTRLRAAVDVKLEEFRENNLDPAVQAAYTEAANAAFERRRIAVAALLVPRPEPAPAAEGSEADLMDTAAADGFSDADDVLESIADSVSEAANVPDRNPGENRLAFELPEQLDGHERLWNESAREEVRQLLLFLDRATPHEDDPDDPANNIDAVELQARAVALDSQWQRVRTTILGGPTMALLRDYANPTGERIGELANAWGASVRSRLLELTGATGAFLVRVVIGTAIMIVSLFFFLYDGPSMVRNLMRLSPLDDAYEEELLIEFDRIVRAIVLALITSAVVQGLTAGLGYWVVGMPSLLFLILITTLCALIPFVGPAIVWLPVCIYLAVYEERFLAASGLAVWGVLAVGSVDNVAKTIVLHGQSSLHPLLALLSILGGVQALGPIGIVVGPLIVTLLQTLLGILQRELNTIDRTESAIANDVAVVMPGVATAEAVQEGEVTTRAKFRPTRPSPPTSRRETGSESPP